MSKERVAVAGPFGKPIYLKPGAISDKALAAIKKRGNLFDKVKGDPGYIYGWINPKDPETPWKIAQGFWEYVREGDVEVSAHTHVSAERYIMLAELALVRRTREFHDEVMAAETEYALRQAATLREDQSSKLEDATRGEAQFVRWDESTRVATNKEQFQESVKAARKQVQTAEHVFG